MQKISGSSSASRKCVSCFKKTGNYRAWGYKEGIEISAPICRKCEKKFHYRLDDSMNIHLKGIQESVRNSIIISYYDAELQKQRRAKNENV